jgi:enoyl-CoA hydratase
MFGHSTLRRMMLTGYRVPGPELFRLGIVEACVPRAALMERVMDLAREIAAKSQAAIRLAKRALNAIEDMSLRDGYRHEQDLTAQLSRAPGRQGSRGRLSGEAQARVLRLRGGAWHEAPPLGRCPAKR